LLGPGSISPTLADNLNIGANGKLVLNNFSLGISGSANGFSSNTGLQGTLEIDNGGSYQTTGGVGNHLVMNDGSLSDTFNSGPVGAVSANLANGSNANFSGGFTGGTVTLDASRIIGNDSANGSTCNTNTLTLSDNSSFDPVGVGTVHIGSMNISGNSNILGGQVYFGSSATIQLSRGMTYAVGAGMDLYPSGSLTLTLAPGLFPVVGDQFNLFQVFGPISGTFSSINFPPTGTGVWDTTHLYDSPNGFISVVPEPTAMALLTLGAAAILGRRRSGKKFF